MGLDLVPLVVPSPTALAFPDSTLTDITLGSSATQWPETWSFKPITFKKST